MTFPETRHSLIVQLQCRDNQPAWEDFVVAYEPFLKRLAARQGVPERHVADVTQQVLLAIARSIDGWKDDGRDASFRRWLSTVSRNIVIKFMTRERHHDATGGSDLLELLNQVPANPDGQQIQQYEHEMINWAAEQVRDEFRDTSWKAFTATVIDGRAVEDVARDLDVTHGSIYMSRSRILAKIRARIQNLLSES
jgi:RNA polymerase sigma-70 factor (ECF subfamily)